MDNHPGDRRFEQAADTLSALASRPRLKILHLLHREPRPLSTTSIAKRLAVTKSTASHHLTKLKDVGLVTCEPKGSRHLYRLSLLPVIRWLAIVYPTLFPHFGDRATTPRRSKPPDHRQLAITTKEPRC